MNRDWTNMTVVVYRLTKNIGKRQDDGFCIIMVGSYQLLVNLIDKREVCASSFDMINLFYIECNNHKIMEKRCLVNLRKQGFIH